MDSNKTAPNYTPGMKRKGETMRALPTKRAANDNIVPIFTPASSSTSGAMPVLPGQTTSSHAASTTAPMFIPRASSGAIMQPVLQGGGGGGGGAIVPKANTTPFWLSSSSTLAHGTTSSSSRPASLPCPNPTPSQDANTYSNSNSNTPFQVASPQARLAPMWYTPIPQTDQAQPVQDETKQDRTEVTNSGMGITSSMMNRASSPRSQSPVSPRTKPRCRSSPPSKPTRPIYSPFTPGTNTLKQALTTGGVPWYAQDGSNIDGMDLDVDEESASPGSGHGHEHEQGHKRRREDNVPIPESGPVHAPGPTLRSSSESESDSDSDSDSESDSDSDSDSDLDSGSSQPELPELSDLSGTSELEPELDDASSTSSTSSPSTSQGNIDKDCARAYAKVFGYRDPGRAPTPSPPPQEMRPCLWSTLRFQTPGAQVVFDPFAADRERQRGS